MSPPATNNFYWAWRSPKKVLMQKSQKFCADFKYVNLKIELLQIFEKKSFSSLFLMRKPLSSDQKWFLRPYFPLIGGIFVLKSGLRFLFRALEVPIRKVRKSPLFQLKKWLFLTFRMDTSNARNKNLRPLFNTNIPPISGKYGLRNHFWSLESGFLMRKREENDFFSKSAKLPILSFWILNVHIIICQFQKRSTVIHFFSLSPCSCH